MVAALVLLLTTVGCGDTAAPTPSTPTDSDRPAPADGTTTLMVYMVGSDLESKAGAGTADLDEMAQSGVDLAYTDVVVCAGASKKWHNDVVTAENLTTLHLTASGFESVKTAEAVSMADPATLSDFLNYAYEQYPADNYDLILWDHGMGPVIGYGKDMLFDKGALTLAEMQEALKSSPFNDTNKLRFVGFDACLMASAELACVWNDYADYLVASQEVEPAFGWNYSFLSRLGQSDTETYLSALADDYLTACEAYFEKKGYDDRDSTLACLDLSKAAAVEDAVNDLFKTASPDVAVNYNALAAGRVDTRALGRASTGSEYDLVDLADMAQQLSALYPDKAQALLDAVDGLVVKNVTNTEGCCGLSLYYPFFNKSYYEREWRDAYAQLGIFDEYLSYLTQYETHWLENDLLETVANSVAPSQTAENTYSLTLPAAQASTVAQASFIVLRREGTGLYNPLFISGNVQKQGNTLVAGFDGRVLYAKDGTGDTFIPSSRERDTVGDVTRYTVFTGLSNMDAIGMDYDKLVNQSANFLLEVNNQTNEVAVCGLLPVESNSSEEIQTGKLEDIDLSQFTSHNFVLFPHYYLTRFDNGVIRPVSEWHMSEASTGYKTYVQDGISFEMLPLSEGEYYGIYQIRDTQGNEYCSELLPLQVGQSPADTPAPDTIRTTWESGDKVTLFERDGVSVSLASVTDYNGRGFALSATNDTDRSVYVSVSDVILNGTVYTAAYDAVEVAPGETVTGEYAMSFGIVEQLTDLSAVTDLTLSVSVNDNATWQTLVKDQPVSVTLGEAVRPAPDTTWNTPPDMTIPVRGVRADEQVLYDQNGVKITLMGLCGSSKDDNYCSMDAYFRFDNTADSAAYLSVAGLVADTMYCPISAAGTVTLPARSTVYKKYSLSRSDLTEMGIDSVRDVKVAVDFLQFAAIEGAGGFRETKLLPVKPAATGAPVTVQKGNTVLYDKDGLTVTLRDTDENNWYLVVTNRSDRGVTLKSDNTSSLGASGAVYLFSTRVPQGTSAILDVAGRSAVTADATLSLLVLDSVGEAILDSFDLTLPLSP